jgi:hypothetical protein
MRTGLTRYALYIFDYGAPTGLRLAMKHRQRDRDAKTATPIWTG